MINNSDIEKFLLKANKPHADSTAEMRKEENGSRTILFADGDWSMIDNFFGGEPYGGQQVVFYKKEPVWICVYYGRVLETSLSPDVVYDFLREALQYPDKNKPQRGPESYKKDNLEYRNFQEGDLDDYSGRETILEDGKEIYWAKFMGGLVDQRFKGSL